MSLHPVVGTPTGVIVMLLTLLGFTSFLSLYIGLKHGLHEGHTLIALKLLIGLLELRGLTCCCHAGLAIAVIATAVQSGVCLVGANGSFAMLAKPLTASLLRDLITQAPRCFPLGVTLGIRMGCSSLTLCPQLLILFLNHDPLNSL
jgi:hypothetical protein